MIEPTFTGTRGSTSAKILVVGECWTEGDARAGAPFSGSNREELDKVLKEAGVDPEDCLFTCVINRRPAHGLIETFFYHREALKKMKLPDFRGLYPGTEILQGVAALEALIARVQPRVIIAMGNYAVWGLCNEGFKPGDIRLKIGGEKRSYRTPKGMQDWRGSHLTTPTGIPVIPVFAPSVFQKNYPWRYLTVHDIRMRVPRALAGRWEQPQWDFIIKPSFDTAMGALQQLLLRATLAVKPILITCDIETLTGFIECIGFAWSRTQAMCIPLMSRDNKQGYWSVDEEAALMGVVQQLLEHPNVEVCGQNFIYDYQHLWWHYNIKANYKQETMLAHHVCYPGTNMGLGYLSSLYCDYHYYWKDDGKEASDKEDDIQRWVYNCRDCVVTFEVMESLWEVIGYHNLWQQYAIQMTRTRSALKMMIRGVRIDKKKQGEEQLKLLEASMDLVNHMEASMPESVRPRQIKRTEAPWYKSTTKLVELFYTTLGMETIRARKTQMPTVDDDALKKIGQREPCLLPLVHLLQDYRSLEAFGQFVNMKTGTDHRMRALFSPTTETFRYRSSADVFGYGRNLQNLPKGNEDD